MRLANDVPRAVAASSSAGATRLGVAGDTREGQPDGALCRLGRDRQNMQKPPTTPRVSHWGVVTQNSSLRGSLENERQTENGQDAKS
jgi:hypothetical protein